MPGVPGATVMAAGKAAQVMPTPEGGVHVSATEPVNPAEEVICTL
jgi:hypothetical protein